MVRVRIERVSKRIYLLRLDDDRTRYFEALWEIPEGVTYNSYVVVGDEGAAVLDMWKGEFSDMYVEALSKVVDLRDVSQVVVHHMEPDHSGALPRLLKELGGRAVVRGHLMVGDMVREFYGIEVRFKPLRDGERYRVAGLEALFIYTPWLHWPETSMSYLFEDRVLFSGDAFGMFSIPRAVFDEEGFEVYEAHARKYFADVVGHYRSFVSRNLDKLDKQGLKVDIIAPLHGVLWRRHVGRILRLYRELSSGSTKRKALVLYASMYGDVEKGVRVAVEVLRREGFEVAVHGFTDRSWPRIGDVIGDAADSSIIIIGAPVYENKVFSLITWLLELIMHKADAEQRALLISSYGWGGVARRVISELLKRSKIELVEAVEYRGSPSPSDEERIRLAVKKVIGAG